jgi:hypothetical protein
MEEGTFQLQTKCAILSSVDEKPGILRAEGRVIKSGMSRDQAERCFSDGVVALAPYAISQSPVLNAGMRAQRRARQNAFFFVSSTLMRSDGRILIRIKTRHWRQEDDRSSRIQTARKATGQSRFRGGSVPGSGQAAQESKTVGLQARRAGTDFLATHRFASAL